MGTKRVAVIAAACIGVGLGCWVLLGHQSARSAPPPPPDPAIPVTAGVAQAQDVPVYVEGLGTVQAISTVNVKSRVDGQIMRAFFTQGQEVKPNDPLFLIDPRPYQATLDQAEATAAKDSAQLAGAQRDLSRYGKLVGSGFQTRQSFEDQQATVGQSQAQVQADNAAIESAKLNLGYTMIRSPIGGRTGALLVDPGNYVQASTGTPLVSITQVKPIYVSFTVPATNLDAIRRNDASHPLDVDAYAGNGNTLLAKGRLSFINNQVATSTGTIMLEGTFANADEHLWPGEFVNARLILSVRHNAVTVPEHALMAGPSGDYVYVIGQNDMVQRRDVQVASRQDGIAVIAKGIKAGEHVVVDGQYRLANNVKVTIQSAPAAQSAQAATNQQG
ncbi:MAG TPA: efflux RND transporter periplasmic adaptor subunit [Acetobacteraceae bacterium]|jgi:multidrug efflux system membrane fusion protein